MDMEKVAIIITEDDEGHAKLITKNLRRAGFNNDFIHFKDGQEVLDFLFQKGNKPHRKPDSTYLLLLDIHMPKVRGTEVLSQIKQDSELCKIPVIMITTSDDTKEIEKCHELGCNIYITKPIDYGKFVDTLSKLGLFLMVVKLPRVSGESQL